MSLISKLIWSSHHSPFSADVQRIKISRPTEDQWSGLINMIVFSINFRNEPSILILVGVDDPTVAQYMKHCFIYCHSWSSLICNFLFIVGGKNVLINKTILIHNKTSYKCIKIYWNYGSIHIPRTRVPLSVCNIFFCLFIIQCILD